MSARTHPGIWAAIQVHAKESSEVWNLRRGSGQWTRQNVIRKFPMPLPSSSLREIGFTSVVTTKEWRHIIDALVGWAAAPHGRSEFESSFHPAS